VIGAGADAGGALSGGGDVAGADRAHRATGSIALTRSNSAAATVGLSLALSHRHGGRCSEGSEKYGSVDHFRCGHARAE
jgi:hypothetical protein